ncbi:hypothetical protein JHW43_000560 [Diplocarpon mali]|nr:hypothetical protein JHW43_000560 [Diplocarpon mali]
MTGIFPPGCLTLSPEPTLPATRRPDLPSDSSVRAGMAAPELASRGPGSLRGEREQPGHEQPVGASSPEDGWRIPPTQLCGSWLRRHLHSTRSTRLGSIRMTRGTSPRPKRYAAPPREAGQSKAESGKDYLVETIAPHSRPPPLLPLFPVNSDQPAKRFKVPTDSPRHTDLNFP